MKQPLVTVAALYGAGIVLGHLLEAPLLSSLIITIMVALFALAVAPFRTALLPLAVFLFGWVNISSRDAIISPWDVRLMWQEPTLVSIQATIVDAPSERIFMRKGEELSHTLAELRVTAVRTRHGRWQPAYGRVMSRTPGVLPRDFGCGQPVELTGIAVPPAGPLAPGSFDYKRHLHSRGIYYEFKVNSAGDWKTSVSPAGTPLAERFREWAQRTLARGLPEQDEALQLQWAMLLGWKTALTSEVSEPFMRSGTMHIFAISGLHIALIAGICVALLRASALPHVACGLVAIPIIWFYTAATGWQASAIRATVMMTVIICGWALRRPTNIVNSLAAAACIILIWEPAQLFQAGFQLSFCVVLSIAVLSPIIHGMKHRMFALDPMLPDDLRPRWQRRGIKVAGMVWASLAVSFAAFIGSMPLIAHYFHLFTPGSLIANFVVVPVSSFALMSGIGALMTGDLFPFATECFNHSGWFWMRAMVWLSKTAADLPAAWCHVSSPGPLLFCSYYGLLVFACSGWLARRLFRWIAVVSVSALLTLHVYGVHAQRTWHHVTILPANRSQIFFVEPAHGGDEWLINCGDAGAVEFSLKPFLQAKGLDYLPHLLLTQGEARHVSGALFLHELFRVRQAHASPIPFRSARYRDVLAELKRTSKLELCITNGFKVPPWTILHPNVSDHFVSGKDNAVVAWAAFDELRVLLVPPLGRDGQKALFRRHPDLRADIVIAEWPEDGELATEWLATLHPKLLLIGTTASSTDKEAAIVQRLNRICPTMLIGARTGAVTLALRNTEWRIKASRVLSDLAPALETIAPSALDE